MAQLDLDSVPAQSIVGQPPRPKTVTAPSSSRLKVTASSAKTNTEQFKLEPGQSLNLTELVLENTHGDSGLLTINLGDNTTLLTHAPESFRTTDYHHVTPVPIGDSAALTLSVTRNTPGIPLNAATPANYLPQRRQLRRPADESTTLEMRWCGDGQASRR